MSLIALQLQNSIRLGNPSVFCKHLSFHWNPYARETGRLTVQVCNYARHTLPFTANSLNRPRNAIIRNIDGDYKVLYGSM